MTDSVEDRRHFPQQRSGCYYERLEDCCWLCLGRFAAAAARSEPGSEQRDDRGARASNRRPVRDGGE
ncbi:hypothetical protein BRC77_09985 [Halobacteriales archaeon QH_8_64_26]|nr:MAG: hypothetical protein BRC77_09985 [Halobacteriales archaeon QH_8_64_26]